MSIHDWSYGRLIEAISIQAGQVGIVIEEGTQSFQGTPQEQALDIAIMAYQARSNLKS